ncbi:enoyl-CoA hydratase [Novosphingobium guangzhouense]|uniref:Enoyl-CoA hydratase n=1 Tax=Novosphingobium guangzhouense TaxID=1850347 RepID=A0A2K2G278_9SPHN|nr:enoyl-CoA hydratase [Novosphingobium guangzhouense]
MLGIGDPNHTFSSRLDTMVEEGFDVLKVRGSVQAFPHAAATLVQLLRFLPALTVEDGLVAESLAYAALQGSSEHQGWLSGLERSSPLAPQGRVGLTREEDAVIATLDRADAGNAIDRPMRDALHEAFALVNLDPTITSITLKGAGRAFCLGADLAEFGTTRDPALAHAIRRATLPANEAARCADRFRAVIDGACVGAGLELAAFASHITATRRSWFQLPELAMGILPGAGGCVSLTRRIGRQRTALMVLSGRRISAGKALEWGLVDALVD